MHDTVTFRALEQVGRVNVSKLLVYTASKATDFPISENLARSSLFFAIFFYVQPLCVLNLLAQFNCHQQLHCASIRVSGRCALAQGSGWEFTADRTFYCANHRSTANMEALADKRRHMGYESPPDANDDGWVQCDRCDKVT